MDVTSILALVAVAFFWGATNPFLKLGSNGIENIKSDSKIKQFFLELKFLATRIQVLLIFHYMMLKIKSLIIPVHHPVRTESNRQYTVRVYFRENGIISSGAGSKFPQFCIHGNLRTFDRRTES